MKKLNAGDKYSEYLKSREPKQGRDERRDVWVRMWCAAASAFNSDGPATLRWANRGLDEYDKKFNEGA